MTRGGGARHRSASPSCWWGAVMFLQSTLLSHSSVRVPGVGLHNTPRQARRCERRTACRVHTGRPRPACRGMQSSPVDVDDGVKTAGKAHTVAALRGRGRCRRREETQRAQHADSDHLDFRAQPLAVLAVLPRLYRLRELEERVIALHDRWLKNGCQFRFFRIQGSVNQTRAYRFRKNQE